MNAAERLYNSIWKDQATAAPYTGGNRRIDLAIRIVGPGQRFLDIGCSDGILAEQLSSRFSETYGLDISETALTAARTRGVQAYHVNVDEQPLPFDDGFFSAITCLDVVEHVFEPDILLAEIARVLSPGGSLYIAFPNMRYIIHIKELFGGRFPKTSGDTAYSYDGGHLHYYTPHDVRKLLAKHGLATTSEWGIVSGGIRNNWKYKLLKVLLPASLEREFLSIEVMLKATKPQFAGIGSSL
jgi:methionine biosynthesis protein MetW